MAHDISKIEKLVAELAGLITAKTKDPFILCGIFSGGTMLGKMLLKRLREMDIETTLYFIKIRKDKERKDYRVIETDLPAKIPDKLIIFLDDAIWTGRTISTVNTYMKKRYPRAHWEFAALLDCRGDATYALF